MKIQYIGNFPPPYGGVTRKNQLLYEALSGHFKITVFHKPKWMPGILGQLFDMLRILTPRSVSIIGVSAVKGKTKMLTWLFYCFNRKSMNRSLYFMMGGIEADRIAGSEKERRWYAEYKCIFVEAIPMKERLEQAGLTNVKLFPNCRKRPENPYTVRENYKEPLKCLFFSNIQRKKGADMVLEAAEQVPGVRFDFYGSIDPEFEPYFMSQADILPNVCYKGIFEGKPFEIYLLINEYDVLLLPTRWKTEGVPGVLVEGKIAGAAEIVSNQNYNAGVVKNLAEGIVLKENHINELVRAVEELNTDREKLYLYKVESQKSAERFYVDAYLDEIVSDILCP